MNRLRDRRLELGRGRVYAPDHVEGWADGWFADYRDLEGHVYGAWADTLPAAHDWIRTKAMEATE